MILAIDLGGTNLRAGTVDDEGVHWSVVLRSAEVLREGVESLEALLANLREQAPSPVEAVVMGFPGTVSRDHRTVWTVTNLPGLNGFDFDTVARRALGVPGIADADVNLLLRHHISELSWTPEVTCAFYMGTGLGNAIAVGNRIYTGAHGASGELGHIPYGSGRYACACGLTSCVETEVSGLALARAASSSPAVGSVERFFDHADPAAVSSFLERTARVLATEINIVDPSLVILGGGVFEAPTFPRERLEVLIRGFVRRPLPHDELRVHWITTNVEAGIRGGWKLFKEKA